MKTKLAILAVALGASTSFLAAQDNPPPFADNNQPPPQREGGAGGVGKRGGPGGFHLLPPRAQEMLKLTDEQKTQIAALEVEMKGKLEKILTAEQLAQLKNMRPPMRSGFPGNQGGAGGPGKNADGKNSGGNDNNMPPGPPPDEGNQGNNPPSGPPPGQQ